MELDEDSIDDRVYDYDLCDSKVRGHFDKG